MAGQVEAIGALVLFSGRVTETLAFYRALGIPLEDERHEDGQLHFACELGDLHFALYEASAGSGAGSGAPSRGVGGCRFPGFVVESVAESLEAVRALGALVLQEPEQYPWGCQLLLCR